MQDLRSLSQPRAVLGRGTKEAVYTGGWGSCQPANLTSYERKDFPEQAIVWAPAQHRPQSTTDCTRYLYRTYGPPASLSQTAHLQCPSVVHCLSAPGLSLPYLVPQLQTEGLTPSPHRAMISQNCEPTLGLPAQLWFLSSPKC